MYQKFHLDYAFKERLMILRPGLQVLTLSIKKKKEVNLSF